MSRKAGSGGGNAGSGGAIGSGGATRALSDRARSLLTVCAVTIDSDGTICATVEQLAAAARTSRATTVRAMKELVTLGLVHVSGETRGAFRYLSPQVLKALQKAPERRTTVRGFREDRARAGGHVRAMNAAQRRATDAEARLKVLLDELHVVRATPSSSTSTTTLAWLKVEATHAVRCFDADCSRCLTLDRVLDDDAEADEVDDVARDAFEVADELRAAAIELVEAARDHGVGARARQAKAAATLEQLTT